jgi:hypothetical protein
MSLVRVLLRLVAVVGPLAVIAWEVMELPEPRPRQGWGIVVVILAGLAVCGFLATVTTRAIGVLARHPDILVPLGVAVTLYGAVDWLASLPALAAAASPFWAGKVAGISLSLSLSLFLYLLLAVLYAGWATTLILQAVDRDRVDLLAGLATLPRWLPRTFAVLAVGTGSVLVLLGVGLALAAVAMPLAFLFLGSCSLVMNLLTAAWLPATLRSRGTFFAALGEGLEVSVRGVGRWWGVVLLQMLLMGWVTFLHFSYTSYSANSSTSHSKTNWSVNAFWTGGYEEGCRWYGEAMKLADSATLPPLVTLLGLMFGVVAVAVKLTVTLRMERTWVDEADLVRPEASRVSLAAAAVLCVAATAITILGCAGLAAQESIEEWLFDRQYHRAVERGESLETLLAQLDGSSTGEKRADRLSKDPDPRVRRSLIGHFAGNAAPATKEAPNVSGVVLRVRTGGGFSNTGVVVLTRFLADPDLEVRRDALRAVADKEDVYHFREPLLKLLRSGDAEEVAVVAESLPHWNGPVAVETLCDRSLPHAVRAAVARGADRYGWEKMAAGDDFSDVMWQLRDDPDRKLRHAALGAMRHVPDGAVHWLTVLRTGDAADRRAVFDIWVDTLVSEPAYPGENYPRLSETENLLWNSVIQVPEVEDRLDGERIALVLHVLSAAARENTARLDRAHPVNWRQALAEQRQGGGPTASAFVEELHRLQLILRVLVAARNFAADRRSATTTFTALLPDEDGAAAPRNLRTFIMEQGKQPLTWCRAHAGGYGSPFLQVNGLRFGGADPGRQRGNSRSLGDVLKVLHLDTDKALEEFMREQEGN